MFLRPARSSSELSGSVRELSSPGWRGSSSPGWTGSSSPGWRGSPSPGWRSPLSPDCVNPFGPGGVNMLYKLMGNGGRGMPSRVLSGGYSGSVLTRFEGPSISSVGRFVPVTASISPLDVFFLGSLLCSSSSTRVAVHEGPDDVNHCALRPVLII
jgi:hypothetical protein